MKKLLSILILALLFWAAPEKGFAQINNTDCTDTIQPGPVGYTNVTVLEQFVTVYYQSSTPCYYGFLVTPILVRGNTERRANTIYTTSQIHNFNKQELIDFARINGVTGQIRYRFGVVTLNGSLRSTEAKTQTTNIR